MEQLRDLINNNNTNIDFTAPSDEISTTEKTIKLPIMYVND
jgi:hypothetical protein